LVFNDKGIILTLTNPWSLSFLKIFLTLSSSLIKEDDKEYIGAK